MAQEIKKFRLVDAVSLIPMSEPIVGEFSFIPCRLRLEICLALLFELAEQVSKGTRTDAGFPYNCEFCEWIHYQEDVEWIRMEWK